MNDKVVKQLLILLGHSLPLLKWHMSHGPWWTPLSCNLVEANLQVLGIFLC
uniref:Uncharacterized protein n=1 Tax=Vitis vinifera TaxID=29760 RepID=F6HG06_VITVI